MERAAFLAIVAVIVLPGGMLRAEPPTKPEPARRSSDVRKLTDRGPTRAQLIESANGWMYVNGQWIHPDGYKFLNNKVVRTNWKNHKAVPKPPGKLALENPLKLAPQTKLVPAPSPTNDAKSAAERAGEERRRNLTPTAAPQTGTHL